MEEVFLAPSSQVVVVAQLVGAGNATRSAVVNAEILGDQYLKKVPLPRIPTFRPYGSIARSFVGQLPKPVWPVPAAE